ncbi:hypothetical protein DEJ03_00285 [Curtobacterium sp. MCLR17_043]|uniref:hypothetical protein n=1 Tax=Curtobacterium sp. MCLR17_043 TaxID=2175627 RepID=UPI000D9D3ECE|nr:hypothetical protein [Curtobacterium sp. MCLR17_043]PYY49015.1 hypothetical protein DEJ03_00285 [Curtobacterium sp. MCLR17_043]
MAQQQSASTKWRERALKAEAARDAAQEKYEGLLDQLTVDLADVLTERGRMEGPVMQQWLSDHGLVPKEDTDE